MSSSQPGSGTAPPMYFCHLCSMEIRPLMTPQPTCPRCNNGFVEEIEGGEGERDDEEDLDIITGRTNEQYWIGGEEAINEGHGSQASLLPPGLDIGQLMHGILRGFATAGSDDPPPRRSNIELPVRPSSAPASNDEGEGSAAQQAQDGNGSGQSRGFRSGTTRLGPVNVTWGFGSQTLSSGSIRPTMGQGDFAGQPQGHDNHVHDDGMGGAGGASDGRFFNHDNPDGSEFQRAAPMRGGQEPDLPPELASLREVFTNLFGGLADGPGGMLLDLFGGGLRGRTGDYVWGQQGLDDVITQLMDQTRGSTAPPPASEEALAKLARFSRHDLDRVRQAKNRECSTCMDSFEEEDTRPQDAGQDSNLPTGLASQGQPMDTDDPPERMPDDQQQDELVMMPCKHLFHQDCLIPWLKTSGTCPVCRVALELDKGNTTGQSQPAAGPSTTTTPSNEAPASTTNTFPTRRTAAPTTASGVVEFDTPRHRPLSSTAIVEEREDTDLEDDSSGEEEQDSVQQRRDRMRRAAESRMGQGTVNHIPGSFFPAEDLD